jgi:hypothetical protein
LTELFCESFPLVHLSSVSKSLSLSVRVILAHSKFDELLSDFRLTGHESKVERCLSGFAPRGCGKESKWPRIEVGAFGETEEGTKVLRTSMLSIWTAFRASWTGHLIENKLSGRYSFHDLK